MDWDDLRFILAVAEHGSLAGAARKLNVSHTTVLRRINAFEAAHGLRLFDRLATGYALTAGGEQFLAAARQISDIVDGVQRKLIGRDLRLEGQIRVSTTDTLMMSILPPILAAFAEHYPGIVLEVSVSNTLADLTRREADVAIRAAGTPPETLVGRKLADVAWALYARAGAGIPSALSEAAWIAPDESLIRSAYAVWLRENIAEARIVARSDSFVAMRELALQGVGVVALPCYLGDTCPGLQRVGDAPLPSVSNELWIITHEELRRTARIAAFMSFVGDAIHRKQAFFPTYRFGADARAGGRSADLSRP
jgi:DNA-binding transcriptional LysR family regulator